MTRTAPFHVVVGTRPTVTHDGTPIPATADIYNAPRPLYGSPNWVERSPDFPSSGWFFAAIDPDAGDDFDRQCAAEYAVENACLDARRLLFVSEEKAFDAGVAYTAFRYVGTPVEAKLAGMIADAKYRPSFIRNGLQALNAIANSEESTDA